MPTCRADGCDREATRTRKTWCEMHYHRLRRTGTTDPRPTKVAQECRVDGCGRPRKGRDGLCGMHHERVRKHGSTDVRLRAHWTGDGATYDAVHQRLRAQRGPARTHACADCGGTARQWSYQRTGGPGHRESETGPYSVDLDDYAARCVPCHKKFDLYHPTRKEA